MNIIYGILFPVLTCLGAYIVYKSFKSLYSTEEQESESDYFPFAYSPNPTRSICAWYHKKTFKILWCEDFALYKPSDCHSILWVPAIKSMVDTSQLLKLKYLPKTISDAILKQSE